MVAGRKLRANAAVTSRASYRIWSDPGWSAGLATSTPCVHDATLPHTKDTLSLTRRTNQQKPMPSPLHWSLLRWAVSTSRHVTRRLSIRLERRAYKCQITRPVSTGARKAVPALATDCSHSVLPHLALSRTKCAESADTGTCPHGTRVSIAPSRNSCSKCRSACMQSISPPCFPVCLCARLRKWCS